MNFISPVKQCSTVNERLGGCLRCYFRGRKSFLSNKTKEMMGRIFRQCHDQVRPLVVCNTSTQTLTTTTVLHVAKTKKMASKFNSIFQNPLTKRWLESTETSDYTGGLLCATWLQWRTSVGKTLNNNQVDSKITTMKVSTFLPLSCLQGDFLHWG